MDAKYCAFTKIINGTFQFCIPVYQRDYSWTEEECKQLWEDILHSAAVFGIDAKPLPGIRGLEVNRRHISILHSMALD